MLMCWYTVFLRDWERKRGHSLSSSAHYMVLMDLNINWLRKSGCNKQLLPGLWMGTLIGLKGNDQAVHITGPLCSLSQPIFPQRQEESGGKWKTGVDAESSLSRFSPSSLWATWCRFKTQLQFWWESFHWSMELAFYVYPLNDVSFLNDGLWIGARHIQAMPGCVSKAIAHYCWCFLVNNTHRGPCNWASGWW